MPTPAAPEYRYMLVFPERNGFQPLDHIAVHTLRGAARKELDMQALLWGQTEYARVLQLDPHAPEPDLWEMETMREPGSTLAFTLVAMRKIGHIDNR